MSFYALPLKRRLDKIPNEYCYLVLNKYPDNYFTPKNGKKLSSQESKEKKEALIRQKETIRQLDSGYFNLYNNEIKASTILESFFVSYMEDNKSTIYRIKPLAAYKKYEGFGRENYYISEFEVLKKLNTKEEVIKQIFEDGLLKEFSAVYFDSRSYANEGYNLKIFDYFKYVKETFNDFEISLSDIMLTNDYNHLIRSKFNRKDTYELTRENIRYLLDNNLIKHFKEYDFYKTELIVGLIDCGLYDVALACVKLLNDYDTQNLLKDKKFDLVLRKWSTNECVKEIIDILNIKPSGLTLTIKADYKVIETKTFDNIGEIKTYLIQKYNVPFDKIADKDVCDLQIWDEDYEYDFNVE